MDGMTVRWRSLAIRGYDAVLEEGQMKIGIISFTARGADVCRRLAGGLREDGEDCAGYVPERFWNMDWKQEGLVCRNTSLENWVRAMFLEQRAMVFVGAAGIAVRAIAPFIKDKMTDPPVVVVDEAGSFIIPILSGHVGGANTLALRIAGLLDAVPVITTATDVNGVFAVDVFAVSNGLWLTDREEAKQVSARLLEGEAVGFLSDFDSGEEEARVPRGCLREPGRHNIWITVRDSDTYLKARNKREEEIHVLRLVPKVVVAGVGCRKGTAPEALEQQVMAGFKLHGIDPASIKALASIDVKKDEPALRYLASRYGWELRFYSADELMKVAGEFEESPFVKETVGVGNVCERACLAGGGRLLFGKQAGGGVTVAAAAEPLKLNIEKYI